MSNETQYQSFLTRRHKDKVRRARLHSEYVRKVKRDAPAAPRGPQVEEDVLDWRYVQRRRVRVEEPEDVATTLQRAPKAP